MDGRQGSTTTSLQESQFLNIGYVLLDMFEIYEYELDIFYCSESVEEKPIVWNGNSHCMLNGQYMSW